MEKLTHTLTPFVFKDSKILILGSFPSPKSRETGFYYGHNQNRFWKVISTVFNETTPTTIQEKKSFLIKHKIALYDVVYSCEIDGAKDSTIKNVTPINLEELVKDTQIKKIYTTGKKADELYKKYLGKDNIPLPSTSPLNASYSLEKLVNKYSIIKS